MAFQVSPGVNVSEIDLTTVVPAVSSTTGAFAGVFSKGPIGEAVLIDSEVTLVERFGKPTADNFESFFTVANFLAYAGACYVVRVDNGATAATNGSAPFTAKHKGTESNGIEVITVGDASGEFETTGTLTEFFIDISVSRTTATYNNSSSALTIQAGDILEVDGYVLEIEDVSGATITFKSKYTGYADLGSGDTGVTTNVTRRYAGYSAINTKPLDGRFHIVVRNSAGTVLETYPNVSPTSTAKNSDGTSAYYKNIVNNNSAYITTENAQGADITVSTGARSLYTLSAGTAGSSESVTSNAAYAAGYDLFKEADEIDISLVLLGKANSTIASYVVDNICEHRRDCVAFISPEQDDSVDDMITFRDAVGSTSYAVMDSGYKYQYDKYNDVYRWVPLNGDVAGLCARTDNDRDPWFSPAGYNRGIIKNTIKLKLNPSKAQRDKLYAANINPVITEAGQGTLLFGDKTLLASPSAFDRINVRRLFIVLEKAIAKASKSTLFEFNDEFTRAQFRNLVEPFLRDVQGRRGIYDFKVVADETNNTAEVIDGNRFVGDIYIKPAKSINFIQLNFVAVRSGVEFEEIVGQF